MPTTIVDVSHYQGVVPWTAVGAAHRAGAIGGVILKATEGFSQDPRFRVNQAGARNAGIPLGYYHFARPSASSGAGQARRFVDALGPLRSGESCYLDLEGTLKATDVSWALEWLNEVAHLTGTPPLIYLAASVLRRFNWAPIVRAGYRLWVASYGVNSGTPGKPPVMGHWPSWTLWQYTSTAHILGFAGKVDASLLADGITFKSLGLRDPSIDPKPEPEEQRMDLNPDQLWNYINDGYEGAPNTDAKGRHYWLGRALRARGVNLQAMWAVLDEMDTQLGYDMQ